MDYNTEYCFSAKAKFLSMPVQCHSSAWHCITTPQGTTTLAANTFLPVWQVEKKECDSTWCKSETMIGVCSWDLLYCLCLLLSSVCLTFFLINLSRPCDWPAEEGGCGYCCPICVHMYYGGGWLPSPSLPSRERTGDPIIPGNANAHTLLPTLPFV